MQIESPIAKKKSFSRRVTAFCFRMTLKYPRAGVNCVDRLPNTQASRAILPRLSWKNMYVHKKKFRFYLQNFCSASLVKKLNHQINILWCRFYVEFGSKRLVPSDHYFGLSKGYKGYRWACVLAWIKTETQVVEPDRIELESATTWTWANLTTSNGNLHWMWYSGFKDAIYYPILYNAHSAIVKWNWQRGLVTM